MFLNGTAMAGQPDHVNLQDSVFLGPATTASRYRFYSVRDTFPGLVPSEEDGGAIVGELYDVSETVWRSSLEPGEPPELDRGDIELDDGSIVKAMLLDLDRVPAHEAVDITAFGGWRAYQAHLTGSSAPRQAQAP